MKTLIILGGSPGWSESSLDAQIIVFALPSAGSYIIAHIKQFPKQGLHNHSITVKLWWNIDQGFSAHVVILFKIFNITLNVFRK